PAPAPAATDLSQIADVAELREKLRALGAKAPREELRRVSSMPAPSEPEKVAFSIDFTKKDTHGDYDTKVEMVNDQGEAAAKMTKGDDRLACYFRPPVIFTNNARINLRIFHEGLRDMRLSVQTVHNLRFNFNFKPPDEGKWGDVVVDLSKVAADGVKLQNIVIQHIEVHGFRKAAKGDQFFELSKFEIVTGGAK
ncbi:MAG: hypothetical protein KIS92_26715, partial [Planctomycetota bacterium]|nr:hypothetical protein [Planctomycetota bacterium]